MAIRKTILYRAVAEELHQSIREGVYAHKLPSEKDLCHKFSVSSMTVRRAINELKHAGIVRSHQGKGFFLVKKPTGKKTLRVGTYPSNPYLTVQKRIFQEFEKDNTGLIVEHVFTHDRYVEFLESQFDTGHAPDVFMLSESQFPYFVHKSLLCPVAEPTGDFWPDPFGLFSQGGHLYAMPFVFSTIVLLANEAIIVHRDTMRLKDIDWEQWKKLLGKYTFPDQNAFGVAFPYGDLNRWPVFLKQKGGGIIEGGKVVIDKPQSQQALDELKSLHTTEKISPLRFGDAYILFKLGKAATTFASFYTANLLQNNADLHFRPFPLPYMEQRKGSLLSTAFAINPLAKDKTLCESFLRFMVSPKVQRILGEERVALPIYRPQTERMDLISDYPLAKELGRAQQILRTHAYQEISHVIGNELEGFWLGNQSSPEATKKIAKDIRLILNGDIRHNKLQPISTGLTI